MRRGIFPQALLLHASGIGVAVLGASLHWVTLSGHLTPTIGAHFPPGVQVIEQFRKLLDPNQACHANSPRNAPWGFQQHLSLGITPFISNCDDLVRCLRGWVCQCVYAHMYCRATSTLDGQYPKKILHSLLSSFFCKHKALVDPIVGKYVWSPEGNTRLLLSDF